MEEEEPMEEEDDTEEEPMEDEAMGEGKTRFKNLVFFSLIIIL